MGWFLGTDHDEIGHALIAQRRAKQDQSNRGGNSRDGQYKTVFELDERNRITKQLSISRCQLDDYIKRTTVKYEIVDKR